MIAGLVAPALLALAAAPNATSSAVTAAYYSELAKPTRALVWLIEADLDAPGVAQVATFAGSLMPFGAAPPAGTLAVRQATLDRATFRWASRGFTALPTGGAGAISWQNSAGGAVGWTNSAGDPVAWSNGAAADNGIAGPTIIEDRLRKAPAISRELGTAQDQSFSGLTRTTVGYIELDNSDGGLDALADTYLCEGRPVRLKVAALRADETVPPLSEFATVFAGLLDSWSWARDSVQLKVRDVGAKLRQPIQNASYGGGGGIDGTEDNRGQTKPLAFGPCSNIPAVLIDPVRLIYQVHDGAIRELVEVYDAGLALDFARRVESYEDLEALTQEGSADDGTAFDIPLNHYASCPEAGCFRLGEQAAGRVTADVRGAGGSDVESEPFDDDLFFDDGTGFVTTGPSLYTGTAAGIVLRLLQDRLGLSAAEIDDAQMRQIDAERPKEASLYIGSGEATTYEEACGRLALSLGCVLAPTTLGALQLLPIADPAPGTVLVIDETMLERGKLERLDLPYGRPWSRWRVPYARNWSPMTDSDFAGAVAEERKAFLRRANAEAEAIDDDLAFYFPDRGPGVADGLLYSQADALTEAERLLALYTSGRAQFRASVQGIAYRTDLLQTVLLVSRRYGLAGGRRLLVRSIKEDVINTQGSAKPSTTELVLWG